MPKPSPLQPVLLLLLTLISLHVFASPSLYLMPRLSQLFRVQSPLLLSEKSLLVLLLLLAMFAAVLSLMAGWVSGSEGGEKVIRSESSSPCWVLVYGVEDGYAAEAMGLEGP